VPWCWESANEGDNSLTDSGKKYKPVGVNFITPSSKIGDIDLEFSLISPATFLPKIINNINSDMILNKIQLNFTH